MARKNMYIKDDPNAKRQRTGPGSYTAGPPAYGGAAAAPPYRSAVGGMAWDSVRALQRLACMRARRGWGVAACWGPGVAHMPHHAMRGPPP